jgi:hypothetical protein
MKKLPEPTLNETINYLILLHYSQGAENLRKQATLAFGGGNTGNKCY